MYLHQYLLRNENMNSNQKQHGKMPEQTLMSSMDYKSVIQQKDHWLILHAIDTFLTILQ